MNKQELINALKGKRSWREAGVTINDVYEILSGENSSSIESNGQETNELREKISRLTEANKQLRAENKQLRAGK